MVLPLLGPGARRAEAERVIAAASHAAMSSASSSCKAKAKWEASLESMLKRLKRAERVVPFACLKWPPRLTKEALGAQPSKGSRSSQVQQPAQGRLGACFCCWCTDALGVLFQP